MAISVIKSNRKEIVDQVDEVKKRFEKIYITNKLTFHLPSYVEFC